MGACQLGQGTFRISHNKGSGNAGGLQVAPAQPQQADANGAAPLMLAGQPHETADASSGQTQQLLRTTPQHCNDHEQHHRADGEGGPPPSAGEQHDPKDAGRVAKHAVAPAANGKQPDAAKGGAAGREEDPAADAPDEQQQAVPDAELPHPGVGQPADEETEVVDLISDSDDERANIPASQAAAPMTGQAVPQKGEPRSLHALCHVLQHTPLLVRSKKQCPCDFGLNSNGVCGLSTIDSDWPMMARDEAHSCHLAGC